MPDSGLLFLCVMSLVTGSLLFLHPNALHKLSGSLNKTLFVLDERLIRHRFVSGLLVFAAAYAFFKLAMLAVAWRGLAW